jgi:hypothetical protein
VVLLAAGRLWFEAKEAPPEVLYPVGAMFLGFGLLVASGSLVALLRHANYRATLRLSGDEPWLTDFRWDPAGVRDDTPRRLIRTGGFLVLWAGFLVPFHMIALHLDATIFLVVLGIFDVVGVGIFVYVIYLVVRQLRYGRTRLMFDRFPFHPGERLEVAFDSSRGIAIFEEITFTLRFIEEEVIVTRRHGEARSETKCWALYEQTQVVHPRAESDWRSGPYRIAFDLPAEMAERGWVTHLAKKEPRYWELEVHGSRPGVDYHSYFPLPVYAKA